MKKVLFATISFMLAFNLATLSSYGSTVEIAANQDSYITSGAPDTNYGASTEGYSFNRTSPSAQELFLAQFDLRGIPKNAEIESAIIYLYARSSGGAQNLVYRNIGSAWKENEVTYNNFNRSALGYYTGANTITTAQWYPFLAPNLVKRWKSGDVDNYGVAFSDTSDDNDWVAISTKEAPNSGSKEAATLTLGPKLTVEYTLLILTTLSLKVNPLSLSVGQPVNYSGKLKDEDGKVVMEKTISIQAQTSKAKKQGRSAAAAKWKTVAKDKTDKKGRFSVKLKPKKTTVYRAYFAGDSKYKEDASKSVKVKVKKG